MSRVSYASIVGSIMYATTYTRPDVTYSLGVVVDTKDQWLVYGESDLKLMGFTDSSFQSDHYDSRSVSGYIFTLNGGAICWKSFKQHTVADSVYEAEYIAASDAVKEAVWLRKFINELGVAPSLDGPVLLYCDSTGAIAQVKEPKAH